MKPDFLDDDQLGGQAVEEQNNKQQSKCIILENDRIVTPWKSYFISVKKANLQNLLTYNYGIDNDSIKNVINNLYYFNSTIDIINSDNNKVLLVLSEAKIVIDLFNNTKDAFIGKAEYKSRDEYITLILDAINCGDYVFYSLDDVRDSIKVLKNLTKIHKISKDDKLVEGISYFDSLLWITALHKIFHGYNNWACTSSYVFKYGKFNNSLLPYEVFCYECSPYIKFENNYCIEINIPLDNHYDINDFDESTKIAILSCYSPSDPNKRGWIRRAITRQYGNFC